MQKRILLCQALSFMFSVLSFSTTKDVFTTAGEMRTALLKHQVALLKTWVSNELIRPEIREDLGDNLGDEDFALVDLFDSAKAPFDNFVATKYMTKINKKIKRDPETQVRYDNIKNNQLLRTLAHSGEILCAQELCGRQPCIMVIDFKAHKDQDSHNYVFDRLKCGDASEASVFKYASNEIARDIMKMSGDLSDIQLYEKQSFTPQSYWSWASSYLPSREKAISFATSVLTRTATETSDKLMDAPFTVLASTLINPTPLFMTVATSFFDSLVVTAHESVTGSSEEYDFAKLPHLVDEHLQKIGNIAPKDQINQIKSWLVEAKEGLKKYQCSNKIENDSASDILSNSVLAEGATTTTTPSGPSCRQLKEKMEKAAARERVTQKMLEEKGDLALLNLFRALQEFMNLPHVIAQSSKEEVEERIKTTILYGTEYFKNKIRILARTLNDNALDTVRAQDKRHIISAAGPGTGKTTGFEAAFNMAGQPFVKIRGEEINSLSFTEGNEEEAEAVFDSLVINAIRNKFNIGDTRVVNGGIIFDDMHYCFLVIDGVPGFFLRKGAGRARKAFFGKYIKNAGETSVEDILSEDFSHGKEWPSALENSKKLPHNTSRVQFVSTWNELPDELIAGSGKTDGPTMERVNRMDSGYMSAEERKLLAHNYFFGGDGHLGILSKITDQVGQEEVKKLDLGIAKEALNILAQEDSKIAFGPQFGGNFGFRGLDDLLKKYKAFVLSKVKTPLDPNLCSFKDDPFFKVADVMGGIEAYKGGLNENMKADEMNREFKVIVAQLKSEAQEIQWSSVDEASFKEQLKLIETKTLAQELRNAAHTKAKRLIGMNNNKLALLDSRQIGLNIGEEFGYLKTNEKGHGATYKTLLTIIANIHSRLTRSREQKYLGNNLIRINFVDYDALDFSFIDKISASLGGWPSFLVNQGSSFAEFWQDEDIYKLNLTSAQTDKLKDRGIRRMRLANGAPRDMYCGLISISDKNISTKYFGYFDNSSYYLLKNQYFSEFYQNIEEGNPVEISWFEEIKNTKHFGQMSSLDYYVKQKLDVKLKLNLWQLLIAKNSALASGMESLIAIILTKDVLETISYWHASDKTRCTEFPSNEALAAFQCYLHDCLNSPQGIALDDGSKIDGRNFTICLISLGDDMRVKLSECGFDKKLSKNKPLDIVLAAPPLSGRAAQAKGFVKRGLSEISQKIIESGNNLPSEGIILTDEENTFLEALIAYDLSLATKLKDYGIKLTTKPLEDSVKNIVTEAESRIIDYFSTYEGCELKSLEEEWAKNYAPFEKELEKEEARIAEEKKRKAEIEKREAEYQRSSRITMPSFGSARQARQRKTNTLVPLGAVPIFTEEVTEQISALQDVTSARELAHEEDEYDSL